MLLDGPKPGAPYGAALLSGAYWCGTASVPGPIVASAADGATPAAPSSSAAAPAATGRIILDFGLEFGVRFDMARHPSVCESGPSRARERGELPRGWHGLF